MHINYKTHYYAASFMLLDDTQNIVEEQAQWYSLYRSHPDECYFLVKENVYQPLACLFLPLETFNLLPVFLSGRTTRDHAHEAQLQVRQICIISPGQTRDDVASYPGLKDHIERYRKGCPDIETVHHARVPDEIPDGTFVLQKSDMPRYPGNSYLRIGILAPFNAPSSWYVGDSILPGNIHQTKVY